MYVDLYRAIITALLLNSTACLMLTVIKFLLTSLRWKVSNVFCSTCTIPHNFAFAVSSRDELHVILAFKSIALVLTEDMQVQILARKGMK